MIEDADSEPALPTDDPSEPPASHHHVFRLTVRFIAAVLLIFISVEGWRTWHDYQQTVLKAHDAVQNLARATAQHAEDAMRQVDVLTDALAERIEGDGLASLNIPRIHALLVQQAKIMPQLDGLFVYDAEGRWIVTDKNAFPPASNNSDRDYFIYHRTHTDRGVHIGWVIKSRSTGDLIIPVSRRLNNSDGSFAGVVLGTVKVSYFLDYYGDLKIDDRGAIVLAHRDGRILVRRPFLPGVTDQSLANSETFKRYLPHASEGVIQVKSIVDGTERLYGYRAISSYPLVVDAGLSMESFIGPWRRDLIKTGVILLSLIGGMVGFGAIVSRQLRLRMEMEAQLRQAHLAMKKMAFTDSLTGLANRRNLDMLLPKELRRARRQGEALALIMIDVDFFKRFNDKYGHAAGDDCLRRVADVIHQTLRRPGDLAVRYGGEEFTMLLAATSSIGANLMAGKILEGVRALHIPHEDSPNGIVTVSAGIATCLPASDEVTPEGLIKAADAFLYMAKKNGRDRWHSANGNSSWEQYVSQPLQ